MAIKGQIFFYMYLQLKNKVPLTGVMGVLKGVSESADYQQFDSHQCANA